MTTLGDAAAALGVPVFPCRANKKPLTLHGFKSAVADPDAIKNLFANPESVLIGMPTGARTHCIVVDVDIKDGRPGMDWLNANAARLPETYTVRTASGGLHLYFIHPGHPVRNSASKIAPGIDVRGDGGYCIIPPSPEYAVADPHPIAELPDWLLAKLCPPKPPQMPAQPPTNGAGPYPTKNPANGAHGTPWALAGLENECNAIATAPDGRKHEILNAAAYAIGGLVSSGQLDHGHAIDALQTALASIRHRCKDWAAATRTLGKAFAEGQAAPRIAPIPRERDTIPQVDPTPLLAKARKAAKAAREPLPIPNAIMNLNGVLKAFVDHCEATAISPQPFLALAAGICMIGAAAGRRYRTTTDLRTNIYAVGVADSGGGKDHARKQVKKILMAANLPKYLGGGDIASGSALRTALIKFPSQLFMVDEFGDWLGEILGDKASSHRKQIAGLLRELYSSANTFVSGVEYSDQDEKNGRPRKDIQQPNACLYGTTTPGQFWKAIGGASMNDGLMARMLMFVSPCSYPDEHEPELAEPPESLVASIVTIADKGRDPGNLGNGMLSNSTPTPLTVLNSAGAEAEYKSMRKEQLELQRKHANTYITAIAARFAENAMKMALISAISRDPIDPLIDREDVQWGRALTMHCIKTLLDDAHRNMADNPFEEKMNKALNIIRTHGPVTMRDLMRRGFNLPAREQTDVLNALIEAGRITFSVKQSGEKGGRPATLYSLTED